MLFMYVKQNLFLQDKIFVFFIFLIMFSEYLLASYDIHNQKLRERYIMVYLQNTNQTNRDNHYKEINITANNLRK